MKVSSKHQSGKKLSYHSGISTEEPPGWLTKLLQVETGSRFLVVLNKELNRLHRVKQSKKQSK